MEVEGAGLFLPAQKLQDQKKPYCVCVGVLLCVVVTTVNTR